MDHKCFVLRGNYIQIVFRESCLEEVTVMLDLKKGESSRWIFGARAFQTERTVSAKALMWEKAWHEAGCGEWTGVIYSFTYFLKNHSINTIPDQENTWWSDFPMLHAYNNSPRILLSILEFGSSQFPVQTKSWPMQWKRQRLTNQICSGTWARCLTSEP